MRDRDEKLRTARQKGEAHGGAKLTEQNVHRIRELLGTKSMRQIGFLFGVTDGCIRQIRDRIHWGHI